MTLLANGGEGAFEDARNAMQVMPEANHAFVALEGTERAADRIVEARDSVVLRNREVPEVDPRAAAVALTNRPIVFGVGDDVGAFVERQFTAADASRQQRASVAAVQGPLPEMRPSAALPATAPQTALPAAAAGPASGRAAPQAPQIAAERKQGKF